jgi:hypothetical protein
MASGSRTGADMKTQIGPTPQYALGNTDAEHDRLIG